MAKPKLSWKRDYGDGYETDDAVLWINGKPSKIVISGAECGWYGKLYYGDKELYLGDTRKELKAILKSEYQYLIDQEVERLSK